jgi:hypothetical protein
MLLRSNHSTHRSHHTDNSFHMANSHSTDRVLRTHMALTQMFLITSAFTPSVGHPATPMLSPPSTNMPNRTPTSSTPPSQIGSTPNRPNRNSTNTVKKSTPKPPSLNTWRLLQAGNAHPQTLDSHQECNVSPWQPERALSQSPRKASVTPVVEENPQEVPSSKPTAELTSPSRPCHPQ